MSMRTGIKMLYIAGMGLLGDNVGKFFSITTKNDVTKTFIRGACIATGVYAGVIFANDMDVMLSNAIDEVSKNHEDEEPDVEVNNG